MKTRAFAIVAVLLVAGCVDDQQTLEFTEICAHPVPSAGTCAYPAVCTLFEGVGRLFFDAEGMFAAVGSASLYMQIQFENQLAAHADPSSGLLDGNDATIEGFRLTYTVISGTATLPFSGDVNFPQTFVVQSASTLAPLVYVIPYTVGASIATLTGASFDMRVDMRARGHYKNGHEFEIGPFPVVVEVRNGDGPWAPACTAPTVAACCGGFYQTHNCACVTP